MLSQAISEPQQAKNLQGCFFFLIRVESNDDQTQIATHGILLGVSTKGSAVSVYHVMVSF